nr:piggyBac transposable element-derived protein 4-like [Nomia melanderi]
MASCSKEHVVYDSDTKEDVFQPRKRLRTVPLTYNDHESNNNCNGTKQDFLWESINHKPEIHPFSSLGGATIDTNGMSRGEIFELFLNQELIEKIVVETNRYGMQHEHFKDITAEELKIYIALCILMSIVLKPELQMYWSRDPSIETAYFANVMSRNRFMEISRNLHFSNNDTEDENDPLRKTKDICNIIIKTFINLYKPHKDISINEYLMKCKSRLHYIQFNKLKKSRFGIKFYKLCDSKTGYVHNFKIYVGKNKFDSELAINNIVINLMTESKLLRQGYCLFIDSWYNSIDLFKKLYDLKTNICGIIKNYRKGIPKEIKHIKLNKGEAVIFSNQKINIIKWQDKREIVILTTMHRLKFGESGKINQSDGFRILKPTPIIDYNKNMNGIDMSDQMLSKFHIMRRNQKAYKKIFFYCIDMMLLNSYILFKNNTTDRAFHVYKQKLAEEIISKYLTSRTNMRSSTPTTSVLRYTGQHFPIRIPYTKAKGRRTSKRCNVCLSQSIRRETVFQCDICSVPLCIDHFKPYHLK